MDDDENMAHVSEADEAGVTNSEEPTERPLSTKARLIAALPDKGLAKSKWADANLGETKGHTEEVPDKQKEKKPRINTEKKETCLPFYNI